LIRKRLSQRSWECGIGVGVWVWIRFFCAWALIFGYEFLLGFAGTLLVSLLPVATVTIRHFCPIKFSRERGAEWAGKGAKGMLKPVNMEKGDGVMTKILIFLIFCFASHPKPPFYFYFFKKNK
jgi:hypothetical protein